MNYIKKQIYIGNSLLIQAILLFCFLYYSCTQSLEIPVPEPEPLLVVNALFSSDSTWKINVSRTSNLQDTRFILPPVENAIIMLYEDDEFIGSPKYSTNGNYLLDAYPSPGKTYRITVEATGFPSAEATDSLPSKPKQISGNWDLDTSVPVVDELGFPNISFPLNVSLSDVADEANFYQISIRKKDSCDCIFPWQSERIFNTLDDHFLRLELDLEEPLSDPNSLKSGIALLSDLSFQGINKKVNFFLDTLALFYTLEVPVAQSDSINSEYFNTITYGESPSRGEKGEPRVFIQLFADVRSISESLYLYEISFFRQGYSTSDPFYEFGNVYSNVENGIGIFAGYERELFMVYSD